MHQRLVQRVARIYFNYYQANGYKAASEYAERFLDGNEELKKAVADEVQELIRNMMKR